MGGSDSKVDPSNGDDGKNADGDDKKQVGPDGGTYVIENIQVYLFNSLAVSALNVRCVS